MDRMVDGGIAIPENTVHTAYWVNHQKAHRRKPDIPGVKKSGEDLSSFRICF
jgi:hypothetical protein